MTKKKKVRDNQIAFYQTPDGRVNIEVLYEKGRFGGWPANFGAWSWVDELLDGFANGYYKNLGYLL